MLEKKEAKVEIAAEVGRLKNQGSLQIEGCDWPEHPPKRGQPSWAPGLFPTGLAVR
jgi:hypothetical protein